jgi:hypothetical protein
MGTWAMCAWWSEESRAYVRERFPLALYVPLAVFLAVAAEVGSGAEPLAMRVRDVLLAWGLVFQFRLWDDLEDRERDRQERPERVLSRARSMRPFHRLVAVAVVGNVVLLGLPRPSLPVFAGYVALQAAFVGWYAVLRHRLRWRVGAALVVLAKYPAFVALLAMPVGGAPAWRLPLAMAVVYLCFGAYELLHDERLRSSALSLPVLAGLSLALQGLLGGWVWAVREQGAGGWAVQAMLCLATAILQAWLIVRWHRGRAPGPHAYALFALCLLQLLGT